MGYRWSVESGGKKYRKRAVQGTLTPCSGSGPVSTVTYGQGAT